MWIKFVFIFLTEIFLTACVEHWGYPDMETKDPKQPVWGGMCDTGKRQSPVDLSTKNAFTAENFPDFVFDNYEKELESATIKNTGHSIQIDVSPQQKYRLSGGGLQSVYSLEQMHWHWWSEHTVDGRRYPLELHIVHKNERFSNLTEAAANIRGIAVIAVLFHIETTENEPLAKVLLHLDQVEDRAGKKTIFPKTLKPQDLLPKQVKNYFRYDGSLTTPSCNEAVIWTIFVDTIPVTLAQVERFSNIKDELGNPLKSNFRLPQPQYNRPVMLVMGNAAETRYICSPFLLAIISLMALVSY